MASSIKLGFEITVSNPPEAAKQHFYIRGNKHDKDRVEIQIAFDGEVDINSSKFEFDTDFILLAPQSFGLSETNDIDTIRSEFQSYLRLQTQKTKVSFETKIHRVQESLQKLNDQFTEASLRHFAIEIESFLKNLIRRIKKYHHQELPEIPSDSLERVNEVYFLLLQFRNILKGRNLEGKKAQNFHPDSIDYDLLLLNEYISHHYVSLIVYLNSLTEKFNAAPEIKDQVSKLSKEEATYRKKYNLLLDDQEKDNQAKKDERYIRKINLLKKYFQKSVFINTKEYSREKKLLIPVYGVSAALAATWAILFQLYQLGSGTQRMGFNTVAFIMLAVFGYVVKDIMKDYFRKYFFRSSQKFFPDYVKKLFFSTGKEQVKLGSIKEFLRVSSSESLPEVIRELRYNLESYGDIIEEDALIYRKRTNLKLKKLHLHPDFSWGFREVNRIQFDRYMSKMDDSHISLNMLSTEGEPIEKMGHKVYHIYLGVQLRTSPKMYSKLPIQHFKLFRISLDKDGVINCKTVEKNIRFKENSLSNIF